MIDNTLISIITPCYNAGRFIGETIESVQGQSYSNWEMIIVDDCSTDNSIQVIKNYAETDNRIRFFKLEKNSGSPAEPRNKAIEESKGEIIAFLDADDIWKPTKLEEQMMLYDKNIKRIIYSDGEMMDENGTFIRNIKKPYSVDYYRTLKHDELSCSAVLVEKKLLDGISFVKAPKEDYVFWLTVLKRSGITAYNCKKNLYSYRLLPNSRSRNKKKIIMQQWDILRNVEKLSFFKALYYFGYYTVTNIKKYYLSR